MRNIFFIRNRGSSALVWLVRHAAATLRGSDLTEPCASQRRVCAKMVRPRWRFLPRWQHRPHQLSSFPYRSANFEGFFALAYRLIHTPGRAPRLVLVDVFVVVRLAYLLAAPPPPRRSRDRIASSFSSLRSTTTETRTTYFQRYTRNRDWALWWRSPS